MVKIVHYHVEFRFTTKMDSTQLLCSEMDYSLLVINFRDHLKKFHYNALEDLHFFNAQ